MTTLTEQWQKGELPNGKYIGVYKSYKAANEAINNQYFDRDSPQNMKL